jgi:hypothetical protein
LGAFLEERRAHKVEGLLLEVRKAHSLEEGASMELEALT